MSKSLVKEIAEDLASERHEFRLLPDLTEYVNQTLNRHGGKTKYFERITRSLKDRGYYIETWTPTTIASINAEWENRKLQQKQNGRQ